MQNSETSNVEAHLDWDDGVVAARKWKVQTAVSGRPTNEALIDLARISPGMKVLDLASGSGHPALDIARVVGPTGHVTATDLSSKLLAVAEEKSKEQGLTNISFQEVDMENQPFPDETFEAARQNLGDEQNYGNPQDYGGIAGSLALLCYGAAAIGYSVAGSF
jgi:SAM-dependent methyltransferase